MTASATESSTPVPSPDLSSAPPGLRRRLACFLYEGVLLFGVVMIAGYLFSSLTQQRHALQGRHGLQAFMFVVLGIYFAWFWSRSGQTLAMKTWHLRIVDARGQAITQARALLRFLASWIWFLPSLALIWLLDLQGGGIVTLVLLAWVLAYAASSLLRPDRQFWHDVLCGTRVVTWHPPPKKR